MSDSIHFEQLRQEAKSILKLCRAMDTGALARMRAQLPRLSAFGDAEMADQIKLADVQHALARELGYSNWAEVKRRDEPLARFLAAVRGGALDSAEAELKRFPDLVRESIHAACSVGDPDAIRYHLKRDGSLLIAEEDGWQPLLYVCGSLFGRLSFRHQFGLHECARELLDRGADPNTFSLADSSDPESQITARVRAVMGKNRLVFLLLTQRGAIGDVRTAKWATARSRPTELPVKGSISDFLSDPDFRQEFNRRMAPIREQYTRKLPPLPEMTMKEFMELEGPDDGEMRDSNLILFRLALERGADPNFQFPDGKTMLHTCGTMPADMGRAMAELFLEHGADPNLAAADGSSPYSLAVRAGGAAIAELLLAHGAKADSASPEDRFIGACEREDSETAWSVLRSYPDIVNRIGPERGRLLDIAVVQNRFAAVKLMAKLGFDLAAFGSRGASALHHAAWHGHPQIVQLLIEFHAPVNVREAIYGTSPLAWAAHGSASSKNWRQGDDDYCAVVESLIDAGADYAAACNPWASARNKSPVSVSRRS